MTQSNRTHVGAISKVYAERLQRYHPFLWIILVLAGLILPATVSAATPLLESARITSPDTVQVVYSEPVYTSLNDYGNFTGALNGASLEAVSGSGTATITLTFAGDPFASNATSGGGMTIGSTVESVSDGYQFGAGPISVVDGESPIISSITLSSNDAGGTTASAGDTITVSFTASESLNNASITIDNHSLSTSGSGQGPWSASYALTASDQQGSVPVSISMTDPAGNQGQESFTLGQGASGFSIVTITSNANTATALVPGQTITFVATLSTPIPNGVMQGSYDGVPLSWSSANGGATYSATFTVEPGDESTATSLQISGVTIANSSGQVSAPGSGSDVEATIDAQSFQISTSVAIPSVSTTDTPVFEFYSPQDGTITYGGDCASPVLSAVEGDNDIHFNALSDGTHSNCTITVTDETGYQSNMLQIPAFTVSNGASVPETTTSTPSSTTSSDSAILSYKFVNPLNVGSTGPDVTALQQRLTYEDVYSGPVTGYYGTLTQAAVEKYQGAHGLEQLGNVGPGTRALLNSGV